MATARFTKKDIPLFVDLYYKKKMSQLEISKHLNISQKSVANFMKRWNLKARGPGPRVIGTNLAIISEWYINGLPLKEIAVRNGISRNTLWRLIKYLELPDRRLKHVTQ